MVKTRAKTEVLDITHFVEEAMKDEEGSACLVFVPHTTAAVTINEYEPNIKEDYKDFFNRIAPKADYRHNKVDGNAEAHLLSALISTSVVVPVHNGKLALGSWQRILLVEGDGPRNRKVYVQALQ